MAHAEARWDEFAQTRDTDDLFDDEIVPITTGQHHSSDDPGWKNESHYDNKEKVENNENNNKAQTITMETNTGTADHQRSQSQSRRSDRERGRGDESRRKGRASQAPVQGANTGQSDAGKEHETKLDWASASEDKADDGWDWAQQIQDTWADKEKEQPREEENNNEPEHDRTSRVPAVRGDRSTTGGVRKVRSCFCFGQGNDGGANLVCLFMQPKLSEDELSRRMAAAKLNAAKIAATHARAEADEASFLEREKVADEKGHLEFHNSQAMNDEREVNRRRKLEALKERGADSWDAGKHQGGTDSWDPANERQENTSSGTGSGRLNGRRPPRNDGWGNGGLSGYRRRDRGERWSND